jgi:hypothetical protein
LGLTKRITSAFLKISTAFAGQSAICGTMDLILRLDFRGWPQALPIAKFLSPAFANPALAGFRSVETNAFEVATRVSIPGKSRTRRKKPGGLPPGL